MDLRAAIPRIFTVVDRTLRKQFPSDYDKRCLYIAFATSALLNEIDIESHIVGGDFLSFVVSTSGQRAGLQGFGGGENEPSHYWVTVSDTIVDMGPHYLTKGSSFPAAQIPFVVWADASALPKFLRYKPQIEYDPSVQLRSTKEIVDRVADFVEQCRARYKSK